MNKRMEQQIHQMYYVINGITASYGTLAKRYGLNYNTLMALYTLEERERCTQKDLCEALQLSKSTIHSMTLNFIKKNLLTTRTDPANKKEKLLCLTSEGKAFLDRITSDLHKVEERALGAIGEEMCEKLVQSNIAFYEAFRAETEREEQRSNLRKEVTFQQEATSRQESAFLQEAAFQQESAIQQETTFRPNPNAPHTGEAPHE